MNKLSICIFHLCIAILSGADALSQAPGSSNTENSTRYVGATRTTLAETLYIGPDADITIDGTWHIYSKYVWISPLAKITGSGTMVIYNSGEVGGEGAATIVDGNDNLFIDVNIVHANEDGMEIKNVVLAADLSAAGWVDNTSVSTLKIGKDFDLSLEGANVWLDATDGITGDFVFDQDATISNYRPGRMVITNNSVQSHMVKIDASDGFIFPVGIAAADYTPAQVTGEGAYHVSVQTYAASASDETMLTGGPERTWHIYADAGGMATVALQHNEDTDVAPFNSGEPHFVTQYSGTAWSVATEESGLPGSFTADASPIPGATVQDLAGVNIPATGDSPNSYLTKANNESVLPVTLVAFLVKQEAGTALVSWTTTEESNTDRFEVERSNDSRNWNVIGRKAAAGESKAILHYTLADEAPVSGINYYRLKMLDKDGTFAYSTIRSIIVEHAGQEIMAYPNPITNMLFVKYSDGSPLAVDVKEISIVDTKGSVIYHSTAIARVATGGIDVRGLTAGIYFVKIRFIDGTVNTRKVMVLW